jgi:hypothetical protein
MGAHHQRRSPDNQVQHVPASPAAQDAAVSPNQVRGRPGQFVQQHAAMGVQLKEDIVQMDGDGEAVAEPEVKLKGDTAVVATDSGDLHLRDAPGLEASVLDKFASGTVVTRHLSRAGWTQVKVWSGNKGKTGWMESTFLKLQPGLTLNDDEGTDKGNPDDYVFADVVGQPFHGSPSADQASQGSIGDCYLIAAMGAVAAQPGGQKQIMDMIKPHGPSKSYTVTFQEEQRRGGYKPVSFKIDMWMPAKGGKLKYALGGSPVANLEKVPLWPAIVEKAYAQWKGGYEKIGGGGVPGQAMSEISGADVVNKSVSSFRTDEALLAGVKAAVDDGQAMTVTTKSKRTREKEKAFSGSGKGPYTAKMSNVVVANSVGITDTADKAPWATDDGKGKFYSDTVGEKNEMVEGTVEYKRGKMSLTYPEGHAPEKADDLSVEYETKYWLSDSPKICAHHAYIVDGVTETGVKLLNPWGSYHPGNVPIKVFRECVNSFAGAKLPKEAFDEA